MSHLHLASRRWVLTGLSSALLATACGGEGAQPDAPNGPLVVRSASHPVGWLVVYLARGLPLDHATLVPDAGDPATWRPTPTVVSELAGVDLLVANGAGLEKWMATASLPRSKVVLSAKGSELILLTGDTHSHGGGGSHSHLGPDPHTWTDPLLFLEQASRVRDAIQTERPGWAPRLESNLQELQGALRDLNVSYGQALGALRSRPVAATEPFWSYLWRRHELTPGALSLAPNRAPGAAEISAAREWVDEQPNGLLLWPEEPAPSALAGLPSGLVHVAWDPLIRPQPGSPYDYLGQASRNIERLVSALDD